MSGWPNMPVEPAPVLVRFDRVYGNVVCYPANQQAEVLARIAGTKSLLPRTLAGARALGLQVDLVAGSEEMLVKFLAGAA